MKIYIFITFKVCSKPLRFFGYKAIIPNAFLYLNVVLPLL